MAPRSSEAIGASLISNIATNWITKQEYEEKGSQIVFEKFV